MSRAYVCIESGETLERSDDGALIGARSHSRYPILGGIPVLTENPDALIRGFADSWQNMLALAERGTSELRDLQSTGARDGWRERAALQVKGRSANIALVERYIAPITAYLDGSTCLASGGAAFLHSHGAGWSLDRMLPYFAQDWTDSPDLQRVSDMLVADLSRHAPDRSSVAVLGAGACGIARAVAEVFDETHAVDLSLPTLLLARGVLGGDALTIHLEQTGWAPVELKPPSPARAPIHLVASDANQLPLRDGVLAAVLTQYLLDLVIDPLATAIEIRRVLKPGGIWVNFSNPLVFPEEESRFGSPRIGEMATLFGPLGFDTLSCERRRFTLLNLDHLHSEGTRFHQEVHHFVMRKGSHAPGGVAITNAAGDSWWHQTAGKVPHRTVQTSRKRIFNVGSVDVRFEIGVGTNFVATDESKIELFELLMQQIDGSKSIADIYDIVSARAYLPRDEFKSILSAMERTFGVISFHAPSR